MSDTLLDYLVSFGIIGGGVVWIVAGLHRYRHHLDRGCGDQCFERAWPSALTPQAPSFHGLLI